MPTGAGHTRSMARRGLVAGIVLIGMLAGGAQAQADIRFKGKSGQGRTVNFRTSDEGMVERFAISWRGNCRRPGFVFLAGTQTTPASPFEVSTRNRFVDVGGYRERLAGGRRARFRARTVGRRVSEHRWRGIFRITVRVTRRGKLLDRCHLRTRWRVRRV
jgi:hypothetical protein